MRPRTHTPGGGRDRQARYVFNAQTDRAIGGEVDKYQHPFIRTLRFSRLSTSYIVEQLISGFMNSFNTMGLNLEDYTLVDTKGGASYESSIFFKFCSLGEAERVAGHYEQMAYLSEGGRGIQVEPSHRGSDLEGYLLAFHR